MDRGSNKHGPRMDEELDKETRSYQQGRNGGGRVEEFRYFEGVADGEDFPGRTTPITLRTNDPIPVEDVALRSEIAKALDRSIFPATRTTIIRNAEKHFPLAHVLERLVAYRMGGTETS